MKSCAGLHRDLRERRKVVAYWLKSFWSRWHSYHSYQSGRNRNSVVAGRRCPVCKSCGLFTLTEPNAKPGMQRCEGCNQYFDANNRTVAAAVAFTI